MFPLIGISVQERYGVSNSTTPCGWEYIVGSVPYVIGPLIATLFQYFGITIVTVVGIFHIAMSPLNCRLKVSRENQDKKYAIVPISSDTPLLSVHMQMIQLTYSTE